MVEPSDKTVIGNCPSFAQGSYLSPFCQKAASCRTKTVHVHGGRADRAFLLALGALIGGHTVEDNRYC